MTREVRSFISLIAIRLRHDAAWRARHGGFVSISASSRRRAALPLPISIYRHRRFIRSLATRAAHSSHAAAASEFTCRQYYAERDILSWTFL